MRELDNEAVLALLRTEVKRAGGTMAWARKHGINRTQTSKVLSGRQAPTKGMIKALGLRVVVVSDLTDQFYVFCSFPGQRARVHLGACRYCQNGLGVHHEFRLGFTSWEGPFPTLAEAEAKMATFNFDDVGRCGSCLETERRINARQNGAVSFSYGPTLNRVMEGDQ
jgi:hypothetical protein